MRRSLLNRRHCFSAAHSVLVVGLNVWTVSSLYTVALGARSSFYSVPEAACHAAGVVCACGGLRYLLDTLCSPVVQRAKRSS